MADNSWGLGRAGPYEGPNDGRTSTGIGAVLDGYAHRGGHLVGARRWAENPLTLTHVHWVGPAGEQAEAVRPPGDDWGIGAAERDVWVQLALDFPAMHPSPAGRDAPWLPLDISPQQAAQLLARLPRATTMLPRASSSPGGHSTPSPVHSSHSAHSAPTGSPGWTGDLRDAVLFDEGISVIPCVEIELPPAVGQAAADASQAFVRDAATTFVRAVHGLHHVRELRGWLRGGRLVLAVRLIVAPGSGAPTREEDDEAMRSLARVLAQQTLPYARLTIAAPGEWAHGQSLPA